MLQNIEIAGVQKGAKISLTISATSSIIISLFFSDLHCSFYQETCEMEENERKLLIFEIFKFIITFALRNRFDTPIGREDYITLAIRLHKRRKVMERLFFPW